MGESRQPWWRRLFASASKRQSTKGGDPCGSRDGNRIPTPKEDKEIARRVMGEGDLPHAAFHVAGALFANPEDTEALPMLDQLLARSRDPLSLAPLKEDNWIGTVALRGLILQKLSRHAEAVGLLSQVMGKREGWRYWRWAVESLRAPGVARQVTAHQGAMVLAAVISSHAGDTLNASGREEIAPAVAASDLLFAAHPDDKMVLSVHSLLVRKARRLDEALQLAERAWAMDKNFMSAIAVAIARKLKGDVDGAVAGYQEAIKFDRDPAGRCTDIATTLGRAGRYSDALPWTQQALRHKPDHVGALSYAMLLRAKIEPDSGRMEEVRRFVRDCGGNADADFLAELQPYVDYLPPPQEATLSIARQMLEARGDKPGKITGVGLSSMESPSSRLAVEMAMGMERGSMPVSVAKIQTPDPRQPRKGVKYLLWRYEGTDPHPALARPPQRVIDAIADLARDTFDIESWTRRAADVARDIGPAQLSSILAVMTYPSPPPENEQTWIWIPHLQLAAALVAARIDEGWEGSLRRDALLSLVFGPDDWTTVAGIVAITQVALELGPGPAAEEGYRALLELARSIPRPGYCCWEVALLHNLIRHPMCTDATRQQAREWLTELHDQS